MATVRIRMSLVIAAPDTNSPPSLVVRACDGAKGLARPFLEHAFDRHVRRCENRMQQRRRLWAERLKLFRLGFSIELLVLQDLIFRRGVDANLVLVALRLQLVLFRQLGDPILHASDRPPIGRRLPFARAGDRHEEQRQPSRPDLRQIDIGDPDSGERSGHQDALRRQPRLTSDRLGDTFDDALQRSQRC